MDITVIIPTYNRLWALPRAIQSCKEQGNNTEIIVIDDGSTDGTWDWLQNQQGIRYFLQQNLGKGWAVNFAVSQSQCKYVRFLDSDDWLTPDVNQRQFQMAEQYSADIVMSGYEVHDEKKGLVEFRAWRMCDDIISQFLGECEYSHYSAFLFRKEFIQDIPHRPECSIRDDYHFCLEVILKKPAVAFDDLPGFVHRHHDQDRLQHVNGLTRALSHYQQRLIFKRILRQLEDRGELTTRRARAASKTLWPLAHWIAFTDLNEACEVEAWIRRINPEFKVPEAGALGLLYRQLGFRKTEKILAARRMFMNLFR
jgi:glycosyltransferase involved in cell wall biosynthesis